jgi:hypothetical protein
MMQDESLHDCGGTLFVLGVAHQVVLTIPDLFAVF